MTCRRPSGRACIGALQFLPRGADPGGPFRIECPPQSEAAAQYFDASRETLRRPHLQHPAQHQRVVERREAVRGPVRTGDEIGPNAGAAGED